MRFKLWIYKSDGYVNAVVENTSINTYVAGAWLLRDESNYEAGTLVWKNAAYPASIEHAVNEAEGFVVAEADSLALLNANISSVILNGMWESRNG